jgi:hypothetical protein
MTWQEIKDQLHERELVVELTQRNRRASKSLRAEGRKETRKCWRLTIQKPSSGSMVTLYRKNLLFFKDDEDHTSYVPDEEAVLAEIPSGALLDRINRSLD